MRNCDKWCIANAGGVCAVTECKGEIRCLDVRKDMTAENRAKMYEASREAFDYYFGKKEGNEDEEEQNQNREGVRKWSWP